MCETCERPDVYATLHTIHGSERVCEKCYNQAVEYECMRHKHRTPNTIQKGNLLDGQQISATTNA